MKKWCLYLLFLPAFSAAQVNFQSSDLPIVLITTPNGASIPDEPKITAQMKVIYNGPGQVNHLSDPPNHYNGYIGIERRGSTSQLLSDKKPYAVETRDANGEDLNIPLLGMPEEADWVFIAPFNDKSLIRDAFALEMARRIMAWAPRSRFVEVMLNGQYQGVYLITEKIKRDKNRVDISKLTENDLSGDELTGGYIIKIDKATGAVSDGWTSPYPAQTGSWQTTYYQYHYPKPDNILPEQKQYIKNWFDDFEALMNSAQYADPETGYPQYLDLASFVDYVIINELTKNIDAYRLSTFLYKDKDSKDPRLFAGPVWDFNIAMGNANYCGGGSYQGWAINFNGVCNQDDWIIHFWWRKLWDDPAFRAQLATRWEALRSGPFSDQKVTGVLDSLAGVVAQAQVRNWQRWPVLNEWVWPNVFCCGIYDQHVGYLRNWLLDRMEWMDGAMKTLNAGTYNSKQYFKTEVRPNPSVDRLEFRYYVRYTDKVEIGIYDTAGRLIETLTPQPAVNGENTYSWPHSLGPGLYSYGVRVNGQRESGGVFAVQHP
ncbi:MAG: CotH kinase family protein [Lewinellaceae bacterium]|nr:CotH kinase family protein [Lewinellaceae bacterium]